MAHRLNRPLPGLRRIQTSVDFARTRWVEITTPLSGNLRTEHVMAQSQTYSDEEEELNQEEEMYQEQGMYNGRDTYYGEEREQHPFPYDERGPQPWEFPSPPHLRLSQPPELADLRAPNDVPVLALERLRNKQGLIKRYVNYPMRLFHLRPQSNLAISDDLDWENTFLWQKVSSPSCKADWIKDFHYPALDMPLPNFPEAILRYGMSSRISGQGLTKNEALEFAAAVLNSNIRGPSDPEPDSNMEWKDIRWMARRLVLQLEKHGSRRGAAMAAKMREDQQAREECNSFFRFCDSDHKPTGMGFRGNRDTFLLDSDYMTDFFNRASQNGTLSMRTISQLKLIPFLDSLGAAHVTTLAVSAQAFREPNKRTYLCHAIARTFPNLERLHLIAIGTVDSDSAARWTITPQMWYQFGSLRAMAAIEIHRNGGSSYLRAPREDGEARFEPHDMSPALTRATGTYADGRGRVLAGGPARTPLVAFGIRAGLLHDPDPEPSQQPGGGPADQRRQDPPLVAAVQRTLTAAFKPIIRGQQAAARATRAEALAKLEGRRTMLPRPVPRGPASGVHSAHRLYQRSEARQTDFRSWPRHVSSRTENQSEVPLPAVEVGLRTREYPRVKATVLVYDRDSFDENVYSGWTGFGPGVDLSHFNHL
ncbi:hypothetical protein DHEL01_v207156 [Diaporthe helianthi]|uniref:Uncharacterized protein n=1 Tax=Diaporthe helianthi TaxID=158607 RepID=A0A2P5HW14_DIAHE|nr:hypothetical protein DHEL01_v207156 [Diaporthe helianthi]